MTTNTKTIRKTDPKIIYQVLFNMFGTLGFIFVFLGFIYIMEAFHSATADVLMLGIGITCASLSVVFLRKTKEA